MGCRTRRWRWLIRRYLRQGRLQRPLHWYPPNSYPPETCSTPILAGTITKFQGTLRMSSPWILSFPRDLMRQDAPLKEMVISTRDEKIWGLTVFFFLVASRHADSRKHYQVQERSLQLFVHIRMLVTWHFRSSRITKGPFISGHTRFRQKATTVTQIAQGSIIAYRKRSILC